MRCVRRLNASSVVRRLDTGISRVFSPGSVTWNRRLACSMVLAGVALAQACGGKGVPAPPPLPVATLTVKYKPTSLTQEYPAQLEASNTVEIRPQVGGIIYRQDAMEGTQVSRGQKLFEIDPQPYEAALLQAQATLAQANAQQA